MTAGRGISHEDTNIQSIQNYYSAKYYKHFTVYTVLRIIFTHKKIHLQSKRSEYLRSS